MRPYILQGHSRPLNQVKFNREGDLLVTCGKDSIINLWWTDNGQRAGTFNDHNGAVWTVDITYDTSRLLSGAGDSTARIWDITSGEQLFKFQFNEPCRAVKFAVGDRMAALTTDPFMNTMSSVKLVDIADDINDQTDEIRATLTGPRGRIARVEWVDSNHTLITASEDGIIRRWDTETGKVTAEASIHEKHIMDLQMSADGTHFVTASNDRTAKLVDTQTLEVLHTYKSTVPVNSAAISPIFDHVLIGGGQEASQVTTTSAKAGKFESRFFHKIFEEEIANVRGHFGPINAVAFSPDGTMFASGGEEGYVRLHHFDAAYYEAGKGM